jgi:hypothetical protein
MHFLILILIAAAIFGVVLLVRPWYLPLPLSKRYHALPPVDPEKLRLAIEAIKRTYGGNRDKICSALGIQFRDFKKRSWSNPDGYGCVCEATPQMGDIVTLVIVVVTSQNTPSIARDQLLLAGFSTMQNSAIEKLTKMRIAMQKEHEE